jgi:protease I
MLLKGKKVAIFLEKMYEDLEFWYPNLRLKEEGAEVIVIAPQKEKYTGKNGLTAEADQSIVAVKANEFHALVIPGGFSPDFMRRTPEMIEFVKKMHEQKKTIAAICHAGWMLASAGILKNKKVTSYFSIKDDMINAGAEWLDQEVVIDDNIITSRNPNDLPAFAKAIIKALSDSNL